VWRHLTQEVVARDVLATEPLQIPLATSLKIEHKPSLALLPQAPRALIGLVQYSVIGRAHLLVLQETFQFGDIHFYVTTLIVPFFRRLAIESGKFICIPPPGCPYHGLTTPTSALKGSTTSYVVSGRDAAEAGSERISNGVPAGEANVPRSAYGSV
jgi:hypothetical protein